MTTEQIKFRDTDNDTILGGILIDDRYIICGCCGGVIDLNEEDCGAEILERYPFNWIDISDAIVGE